MTIKFLHVVGARPNFMKAAPVMQAIGQYNGISQMLIHTGQHYDDNMSEVFFRQLGLPEPDVNLGVGTESHAVQTAQIMMRIEDVLLEQRPDLVLVYGDVNSTVAAALVCAKLLIPVGSNILIGQDMERLKDEAHNILNGKAKKRSVPPLCDGKAGQRIADIIISGSSN